jgi:hypothetical protein
MLMDIPGHGELFHTPIGAAFADVLVSGHRQTWPIRSKRFRTWLRRRYYRETGGTLSATAITSTLDLLEARAQFDGLSGRFTSASPSMPVAFILTSPTRAGAPSKFAPADGA